MRFLPVFRFSSFGFSTLTSTLLVLALAHAAPVRAQWPAETPSTRAVAEVFNAGIAAFNAHDLDTFMRQWDDDVEMYTPTGWVRGKPAVRERFAGTFAQFPNVRMDVHGLRLREAAPGIVIVDFSWAVYPMGRGPAFHGLSSGVYLRRGESWVEVLEHETVTRVDPELTRARP
jgi:hypothetical protein